MPPTPRPRTGAAGALDRPGPSRRDVLRGSLFGAAALAAPGLLSACDSGGTAGGGGGDGQATVRLWTWYNEQRDEWPRLIEEFQAENPDVVVENRLFGDPDSYLPALQAAVSAGDPPEIFAPHVLAIEYGKAGVSADLRQDLGADFLTDFFQSTNDEYTDEGRQYALGWMAQTFGIFYDPEILDRAGAELPETWDDLIQTSQAVTAAGALPLVVSNNPGTSGLDFWLPLITQVTNDPTYVLDLDQQRNDRRWTDAPVIESLQKMQQLVEAGALAPNANAITGPQGEQLLYTGRAGMLFGGSWIPQGFVQSAPPEFVERYQVLENPAWAPGAQHWTANQAGAGLAVSEASPNKEAALEFIRFMYEPERYARTMNASNSMPSTKSAAAEVENPVLEKMTSWLLEGNGAPHILFGQGSSGAAAAALAGLVGGDTSPEETAAAIQQGVEQARNI